MQPLHAAILGLVEGITEFLPVSSTFHLIWTSYLLRLGQSDFVKLFEVFIQGGAMGAVILLYWREMTTDRVLIQKLACSFLPTALIGFALHGFIKNVLFSEMLISAVVFTVVGGVFILVECIKKEGDKKNSDMTYKDAILIGIIQAFAVMPGVSRAGAVIVGMMVRGYRRADAAMYSFLLAVPTILAASGYDLYKMRHVLADRHEYIFTLLIGSIVSLITALISIKILVGFLKRHTLLGFGIYRVIIGIILVLFIRGIVLR